MKKVLILAYDFPPYVSIGGLRPHSWYLNFKKNGIEPVVITRDWQYQFGDGRDFLLESSSSKKVVENTEYGTILRTPFQPNLSQRLLLKHGENKFKFIRKSISFYYEIAQFILPVGTKKELYKEAKSYLSSHKVDYIIATGEPFVLMHYASRLSRKFDTKWIADYRDPWNNGLIQQKGSIIRNLNRYFERRALKNVTLISTVTEYFKELIGRNVHNKPFILQRNGYNSAVIEKAKTIEQNNDVLTLSFAGTVNKWNPLEGVFSAFEHFLTSHPDRDIRLNIFGSNTEGKLRAYVNDHCPRLEKSIHFYPKLPNDVYVQRIAESNVLLLLNDYSNIGTKIYDYLGVQRKILLCYEQDEDALKLKKKHYKSHTIEGISDRLQLDLIEETKAGLIAKDANHLQDLLLSLTNEFDETKTIRCDSIGVDRFSREANTKLFSEQIYSLTNE